MAGHVQLVLREDVQHLGVAGEVVRVRAGYARNFLLPRGMAVIATRGSVEQIESQKKAAVARAAKLRASAQALAETLQDMSVQLARQAGDGDKLYGSVTAKDITDALAEKGYTVDRRKLTLPSAIKDLGEHQVIAKLGHEVEATFKVVVSKA